MLLNIIQNSPQQQRITYIEMSIVPRLRHPCPGEQSYSRISASRLSKKKKYVFAVILLFSEAKDITSNLIIPTYMIAYTDMLTQSNICIHKRHPQYTCKHTYTDKCTCCPHMHACWYSYLLNHTYIHSHTSIITHNR